MNIVRTFFSPKSGHFLKKCRHDLPRLPPSSYTPGNINWFIKGSFKNDVTGVGKEVLKISDKKWHRGEGVNTNSDITIKKDYMQEHQLSFG